MKKEKEIRQVYINCTTPGSVTDINYKGYMKKVADNVNGNQKVSLYEGYFTNGVFDDCIGICIKGRKIDETIERTRYYLFPKSSMKNPTAVVLKRDLHNGNVENYGEWGSADFYGIDDVLYFDAHGQVFSYDILVAREGDVDQAEKFLTEKQAEFSKTLADEYKSGKYNQFLDYYNNRYFKSSDLTQE